MHINLSLAPIVALLAGILILVMPRMLNYIVAIYLIITGVLGLMGGPGSLHLH
jgi:threonine/homoserine efflux transporter RhtA